MKSILKLYLGIAILTTACESSMKVTSDFDRTATFSQYKTYSLFNVKDNGQLSPLNRDRIVNAVKAEMNKKGFSEAAGNPDTYINITAVFKDKQSVSVNTDYYGYGGYYRPYGWAGGMNGSSTSSVNVYNYKDGSLIIDITDASQKKLLWQGIGNKEIDHPLKNPDTDIPKAVAKIMEKFPPKPAK